MKSYTPPTRIIVVDDDPDDRQLIKLAMRKSRVDLEEVLFLEDGDQAFALLEALKEDDHWPELILLDLNMARMGGIELLEKMDEREWLSRVAVIMLTTSNRDEDIERAYGAGAHSYVTKPHNFKEFVECINVLLDYLENPLIPARTHTSFVSKR